VAQHGDIEQQAMYEKIQSKLDELSRVKRLVYGLNPLLGWLRENNRCYGEFLRAADIPESALDDPDYSITPDRELAFYSSACRGLDIADLGLIIGPRYHISNYGILGLSAMTAANLYECYRRFFDHIILAWTYFRFSLFQDGGEGVLAMDPLRDLGDACAFMRDRDISASYTIACEALGRALPLTRVDLKQAGSSYEEKYTEVFAAPVRFGAERDALVFDARWLGEPLEKSDPPTSQVFSRQCDTISEALSRRFSLTERIRAQVMNWKDEPKSLEELAESLHTTPRTIQRKLAAEGVSYKELVEDVRINLAIEYLYSTDMSVDRISVMVGYADSSGFSNAFKRATGKRPGEYRRSLKDYGQGCPPH
jgi:AraC-like DNA-binding protein